MVKKLIVDCDNTFSIEGCDLDDGLAIIYSLAQEDLELLGVNTTFGNNSLDLVYPNTLKFMKDIGREDIAVYRGQESNEDYEKNEAAKFLVEMADKHRGELSVLATGSLTNLYHAWLLDREFYDKLDKLSLMGGITEPLIINGRILNELNFSCNYEASLNVLEHARQLIIATGNTCLDGFFTKERFDRLEEGNSFERWLHREGQYWFKREKDVFLNDGIYIWDILSAVALLNPDQLDFEELTISPDKIGMKRGRLLGKGRERKVSIPKIKNLENYIEHVYEQYRIYGEGWEG